MFGSCSLFKIYLCQIPPGEAKKDYIWSSEWPRQDIHQLIWTAWMEVWPSTFTWVVIWTTWVDLLSLLWWKPWRTFVLSVIHLSKYKKHLLVSVKTRILKCIKLMIERNANIAGKMKTHSVLVKKKTAAQTKLFILKWGASNVCQSMCAYFTMFTNCTFCLTTVPIGLCGQC